MATADVANARAVLLAELAAQRARKTLVIASPAAGAEWSVTVPGGRVWYVHTVRYQLVTSATVATRISALSVTDSTTEYARLEASNTQPATQTKTYMWVADYGYSQIGQNILQGSLLPSDYGIAAGSVISSVTGAIQAGDQYSAISLTVRELSEWDIAMFIDWAEEQLEAQAVTP